jgi:ribosomal protein L37AE/L43A
MDRDQYINNKVREDKEKLEESIKLLACSVVSLAWAGNFHESYWYLDGRIVAALDILQLPHNSSAYRTMKESDIGKKFSREVNITVDSSTKSPIQQKDRVSRFQYAFWECEACDRQRNSNEHMRYYLENYPELPLCEDCFENPATPDLFKPAPKAPK